MHIKKNQKKSQKVTELLTRQDNISSNTVNKDESDEEPGPEKLNCKICDFTYTYVVKSQYMYKHYKCKKNILQQQKWKVGKSNQKIKHVAYGLKRILARL